MGEDFRRKATRTEVDSMAVLLKQELEYTNAVLASRRTSIEKTFWDLERADTRDSAPITFTV